MKAAALLMLMAMALGLSAGCRSDSTMATQIRIVDSADQRTGIAGEVVRSPILPVARPGEEQSAPLAGARIVIEREGGGARGSVVSDERGRFYVELAPGTYTLVGQRFEENPYPLPPAPAQVIVDGSSIVRVRIDYDTGIR